MNIDLSLRNGEFRAAVTIGYEQAERGELIPWTPELRAEIARNVERKASQGCQPNADVVPPDQQSSTP